MTTNSPEPEVGLYRMTGYFFGLEQSRKQRRYNEGELLLVLSIGEMEQYEWNQRARVSFLNESGVVDFVWWYQSNDFNPFDRMEKVEPQNP